MNISIASEDDPIAIASDDEPMDSILYNDLQNLEEEIKHNKLRIGIPETPEPQ